jgi:hypothetical protein
VQASVTDTDLIAEIQYFANTNWIGTGLSPDYAIEWTNPAPGQYVLVAKAVDQQGAATFSPPVNLVVNANTGIDLSFWGARVLPGGKFFAFYNAYPFFRSEILGLNSLIYSDRVFNVFVRGSGAFVDESLAGQHRFYLLRYGG